jgi:serine/threonine protein kinase
MELIRGETLSARLKRVGKIEPQKALAIAVQLCQALGAAHQARILHRDFKCSNVMLIGAEENIRAVVTDFGISRWMRSTEEAASALTTAGAALLEVRDHHGKLHSAQLASLRPNDPSRRQRSL